MKHFKISLKEMLFSLWRNRNLTYSLTKREVIGRYRGSLMGIAWSFFIPITMLVVYTFVFSVVFKAKWGIENNQNKIDYAINLFVGLIVHGLFAECINRAPQLILSNANFVKKVIFPLEILVPVAFMSALFHCFISLIAMLLAQLAFKQTFPYTVFMFPIVLLPLSLATLGFSWCIYTRYQSNHWNRHNTVIVYICCIFSIKRITCPISKLAENEPTSHNY